MAKLNDEQIAVRETMVDEMNLISESYNRILNQIRQCESEKRALKQFKRFRITLEVHERQGLHLGREN